MNGLFRRHLLLLVKEALQNVMKHAAARKVCVSVALQGGVLNLSIVDDGLGFSVKDSMRLGNGLTNMQHRVAELDGSMEIISRPGEGTEVLVQCPVDRADRVSSKPF